MKIHFIAIGGSIMHNLAIDMHKKGYTVSGSDDFFYEPSKSRLQKYNLLPKETGWFPHKITPDLDAVILGMHARIDNPELLKAQEINLKIYSFPEYMFEQAKNKKRIVIAGSHGKTTVTAMILHVLKNLNYKSDYLVGSQIEGFEEMVQVRDENTLAVYEGDEYFSSPLDKKSKFLHYHPHILVLTGISWDHMNVFPTFNEYVRVFENLLFSLSKESILFYDQEDEHIKNIILNKQCVAKMIPYNYHPFEIVENKTFLLFDGHKIPIQIFGKHNLSNLSVAKQVCLSLGITEDQFYQQISTFSGAAKRLELVINNENSFIYRDFAHAPSKVMATVQAVKSQYPNKKIIACLELHTYSSLNADFLPQYKNTLSEADYSFVFFDKRVLQNKKLSDLSAEYVKKCFNNQNVNVFNDRQKMEEAIISLKSKNCVYVFMSSGDFNGMEIKKLSQNLLVE